MSKFSNRLHSIILKLPGIFEKIVAGILVIGVIYSGYGLVRQAFNFTFTDYSTYLENLLAAAFNVIIVLEFIKMLVKHSMNTIVEVLIFAIARGLVIGHEDPTQALLRIASIALLLLCRKYLFKDFDFKEEE
ncbi:MAG: phosphate-starvation-inducible PsiE family protein [Lachnospiraceae bacterium]|nr:phosphate-starvation-inducible PsiE family protein [Lachnospiraceae bacterium]